MSKKALIVGINYPGTSHELRGCVNDANLIKTMITDIYEFANEDIRMLTDAQATTANIIAGLNWLVDGAVPGDVIYFHYSGHGSQMYDTHGDEVDGLDEIICPVDLDWNTKVIRDDDMKAIFDTVPAGVNLTVTLDCCNSGGGLDQSNQYQSLGEAKTAVAMGDGRFLPPPDLTPEQALQTEAYLGFKPRALITRDVDTTGLLISGCQAHQTSADAYIDGRFIGACTYFLERSLRDHNYDISYKALVDDMNADLAQYGFTQRPELNGSAMHFDKTFMNVPSVETQSITSGLEPVVNTVVDTVTEVAENIVKPEKKTKIYIAIGIAVFAALAYFLS